MTERIKKNKNLSEVGFGATPPNEDHNTHTLMQRKSSDKAGKNQHIIYSLSAGPCLRLNPSVRDQRRKSTEFSLSKIGCALAPHFRAGKRTLTQDIIITKLGFEVISVLNIEGPL